jgi:phage shock protein PspC (stress-responsive transcriptional regulator)
MIGGVAGGIAEYFDIDPVIPRILFVLLALANGIGLVIYIVLWIVVPERPVGALPGAPGYVAGTTSGSSSGSVLGAVVVGTILVAIGVAWLLAALDIADLTRVRWELALPIALIATGAALVLFSGRGGSGGLVTLGVLLTVAMVITAPFRLGFDGAFGDQVESPTSVNELDDGYSQVFGSLNLDLRDLELPEGKTDLETSVVFGSVQVRLPEADDIGVRVEASTLFGSTQFPDRTESSGIASDRTYTSPNYDEASRRLDIKVNSVFGSAEILQ